MSFHAQMWLSLIIAFIPFASMVLMYLENGLTAIWKDDKLWNKWMWHKVIFILAITWNFFALSEHLEIL